METKLNIFKHATQPTLKILEDENKLIVVSIGFSRILNAILMKSLYDVTTSALVMFSVSHVTTFLSNIVLYTSHFIAMHFERSLQSFYCFYY